VKPSGVARSARLQTQTVKCKLALHHNRSWPDPWRIQSIVKEVWKFVLKVRDMCQLYMKNIFQFRMCDRQRKYCNAFINGIRWVCIFQCYDWSRTTKDVCFGSTNKTGCTIFAKYVAVTLCFELSLSLTHLPLTQTYSHGILSRCRVGNFASYNCRLWKQYTNSITRSFDQWNFASVNHT